MRDLDRIEEQEPRENGGRRLLVLALATVVTVCVVFAMGGLVDAPATAVDSADPLATLTQAEGLAPVEAEASAAEVHVEPRDLTFPETLVEESRPDVAALLAAANAEYEHPDLLEPAPLPPPAPDHALSQAVANSLPAGFAAQDTDEVLARNMRNDPLVAESLPLTERPAARAAAAGHEGPYTLQVISFHTSGEAEDFASTLRNRGHAAFVMSGDVPGRGVHWRVRIGPFETQREADAYRDRFEREEQMNTFILRRGPRAAE